MYIVCIPTAWQNFPIVSAHSTRRIYMYIRTHALPCAMIEKLKMPQPTYTQATPSIPKNQRAIYMQTKRQVATNQKTEEEKNQTQKRCIYSPNCSTCSQRCVQKKSKWIIKSSAQRYQVQEKGKIMHHTWLARYMETLTRNRPKKPSKLAIYPSSPTSCTYIHYIPSSLLPILRWRIRLPERFGDA
jgi:hypothetical protein